MNLFAAVANSLWMASSRPAYLRFRRALNQPAEIQLQLLRDCLSRNAESAYGREHGFGTIRSCDEFARRVPLTDYDALEPWIDRIVRGEDQVLTRERVSHLIPTSGSSGGRKLIPFTAGLQREFNRATGAWIADLYRGHPSAAFGMAYWSITPAGAGLRRDGSAVPVGFDDDSAYLGGFRKRLVSATLAAPAELRHVTDMKVFRYLTLLCLVRDEGLRLMSVWHPSFLGLLLDALPGFWESLLRDVETGSCRFVDCVSGSVRAALKLRPLRQRSRQLSKADPARPGSIWPHLQIISCWGDGNAEFAATDLERRLPGVLIQRKGLLATEAFVTFPFSGSRPLAVCSHFFEFLDDRGRLRLAHELRQGERYEVVVTTSGGLYRYQLHDEVEVTGFLGRTPALRFLGRTGSVSDRFGEKLSETFVAQVLQQLEAFGLFRFALLAPDEDEAGWRYTFYVEGEIRDGLAVQLDILLKRNPHYAWCRELGQLQVPDIFLVREGGYEAFVARELARGRRLGEIKPCVLSLQTGWSRHFKGEYRRQAGTESPPRERVSSFTKEDPQ